MKKAIVTVSLALSLGVFAAIKGRLDLHHPELFFRYTCDVENLNLSSDEPIPQDEARAILQRVAEKLETSPLYERKDPHRAFICNSAWRQEHYLHNTTGGMNYYPTIGQSFVFLRSARWGDNRLLSPRGLPIGGKRTLDYYITHEFTHSLVFRNASRQIPHWLDEGYCDWIGLGRQSSYYAASRTTARQTAIPLNLSPWTI